MLRPNTTHNTNDPFINTSDGYYPSNQPSTFHPHKLEASLSPQPASYTSNKLQAIHPNPSLFHDSDEIYNTTKRFKTQGKEYYMLQRYQNDQENFSQESLSLGYSPVLSYPSEKLDSDFSQPKIPYPDARYLNPLNAEAALSQAEDEQFLYQALLQNLYNNALMEAEVLRRYNELQELTRLQNLSNGLGNEDLMNLFLQSLYEKQRQDYYNFYLLQEAQKQLESSLTNVSTNYASPQHLESERSYERKSPEVILISDEENSETSQGLPQINTMRHANIFQQNIRENQIAPKEFAIKQENNVHSLTEEYQRSKEIEKDYLPVGLETTKILKEVAAGSGSQAKQRAVNRWKIAKEYQEFLRAEAEKPYVIDVHIDPTKPDQKVEKTPVGKAHQTVMLPFKLNHERKPARRMKLVWRPDVVEEGKLEEYLRAVQGVVGEKITNQEKVVKLFVRFGMDIGAVIDEIAKNKTFYRNYLRTDPRVLRKRG